MGTIFLCAALLSADYMATESTLAAGIEGYKKRADAVRKEAIGEAERQLKQCTASLAAARRGKIDAALVGTRDSAALIRGREFFFGTANEKAVQIAALSREVEGWRECTIGLRSRKLWPQLMLDLRGATAGATGVFVHRTAKPIFVLSDSAFVVGLDRFKLLSDVPQIIQDETSRIELEVQHDDGLRAVAGEPLEMRGVFQFAGVSNGRAVLRRTAEIPVHTYRYARIESDGGVFWIEN